MEENDLRERLEGCEDRYRTLLEINNAIVSNLHKDRLFKVIAEQIKKVLPFDRAGITLYDPARDCFRIYVLETAVSPLHLTWETEIPHPGSAIGWVLDQRRYHLRSDLAKERLFFEAEGVPTPVDGDVVIADDDDAIIAYLEGRFAKVSAVSPDQADGGDDRGNPARLL